MADDKKICSACGGSFPLTAEHFAPLKKNEWRGWSTECRSCRNKRFIQYYQENRAKLIARAMISKRKQRERPEVRDQERESSRERKRRQLADTVERKKHNARGAKWRSDHPAEAKLFKHEQPAMKRMRAMTSYCRKVSGIPSWLTKAHWRQIQTIYAIADYLTHATNIKYEVDHYYPLRHPQCCGLHVPWNLRVITQAENQRKGNRLPD